MKKIIEILKNKKPVFSFEFFPPKTEEGENKLEISIQKLKQLEPDFVSVTYGAGGSTKIKTEEWVTNIQNRHKITSMAHLTCINTPKEDIYNLLNIYKDNNILNIMALRGDIAKDTIVKNYDFRYANELIYFIKKEFNNYFSIGAACYPEKHPEAKSLEEDIFYLRKKVESGADFLITQLFFDNSKFYIFKEKLEDNKIEVPLIAGIMPITAFKQIEKFTKMTNCSIPKELLDKIEQYKNNEEDLLKISMEFSIKQCIELLKNDVHGIHFYTLNQSDATFIILKELYKIFNISQKI